MILSVERTIQGSIQVEVLQLKFHRIEYAKIEMVRGYLGWGCSIMTPPKGEKKHAGS